VVGCSVREHVEHPLGFGGAADARPGIFAGITLLDAATVAHQTAAAAPSDQPCPVVTLGPPDHDWELRAEEASLAPDERAALDSAAGRDWYESVRERRGHKAARDELRAMLDRQAAAMRRHMGYYGQTVAAQAVDVCRVFNPASRDRGGRARPGACGARRRSGASRAGPSDNAEGDGEGPPSPAPVDVGSRSDGGARPSNSPGGEEILAGCEVGPRGVDTVFYAFRPGDRRSLERFLELPHRRMTRRERGASGWATQRVGGVKMGAYAAHGLLVAAGRLASILSGDLTDSRLGDPDGLILGAQRARETFATLDVAIDCPAVISRLDLAAEVRFGRPADGLRFLAAMTHVDLPRHDRHSARQTGHDTSIAWETARGITLRLYDAGLRHRTDPPGVRIRLERQVRYDKSAQRALEDLTTDLSTLYLGPLRRLIDASASITVSAPAVAEQALIDAYLAGERSLAITERLLGAVFIRKSRLEDELWSDSSTRAGRLRELRTAGIHLDDTHDEDDPTAAVNVRPLLEALAELWR
jgi:hypothetical protein